ncbi:histidine kinase [Gluconobacter thailandicus]|uniref:PAS domain-containing protein n=1 Tax=Gluconobacter thailandicus TaxID=257438 RepID=UPI000777B81F|nr:PAS domain-containing protein [Gluconobacter thailandicus]KXV32304.1 histidine kinase [Gluconobacter thailandicus]
MMSSEEGRLADEEELLSSEMRQTRSAFQSSSINHCLMLAATLGGGAAVLVAQAQGQEWILASAGDDRLLEALTSSPKAPSICRLSVHTGSPEVWLCVRQTGEGLESVRALCEQYARDIFRPEPDLSPVVMADQLRRLERRIKRMAEAAEMGFFRASLVKRVVTGDERFAMIWGLSPAQAAMGVPLENFYSRLHPEDRKAYETVAEEELRQEGSCEFRFRIIVSHEHGPTMVRHLLMRAWMDDDQIVGDDLSCVGVIVDLSNATMTAEALRSSEAFTRLLLSSSPDCIHILDREGCIRFVNEGGIRAMELDSPIILHGIPWVDLWRSQARARAVLAVNAAIAGETGRFQGYAMTMRGNRRFWDVAITPVFDEDGEVQKLLAIGRDLTEVNQSAVRLKLALDAGAIAGTWVWDDNSGLVIGDARLAETLGLDAKALQQGVPVTAFYEAIEPEDQARVAETIANSVRVGGKCEFEFRVQTPSGVRWFEGNGRCDLNEERRAIRFTGIVFDIDQSKRQSLRQTALVELGDRLRALENADEMEGVAAQILCRELNVTCAAYGTVDEAGTGLLIGAMRTVSLGKGTNVHQQASIRGFHAFRDYGEYGPLLARGRTVAISDVQEDPLTAAHTERFALMNIRAVMNVPLFKFGRLVGVMCVHSSVPHVWAEEEIVFTRAVADRTHAAMRQAKTQQQLREMNVMLEERIRQRTRERDRLWTIAKDLFVIISRNGYYLAVSPSWLRALGYAQEGLVGLRIDALCHPDDQAAVRDAFDRAHHGSPWSDLGLDVRMLHRNGTWRIYNWNFNNEGDSIYGVGRDITERNDLEEQLRQSQKMEAVGQLTGGLAHDFNNLLAGIGGSLELLDMRLSQGRTTGLERYIGASQEAVRRASSLTHRLLAFSRRQPLDPVPTDVNELVSGLEALLQGSVGPAISLDFQLASRIWTTRIDPNQLENAILNICINARDAMQEKGNQLRISTSNSTLGSGAAHEFGVPPGDYVLVQVEDDGCGMSDETAKRAFDPFFTTKPQGKGTGLGLSMIYGFARQSGGGVSIRSHLGEGTSVSLFLPRYDGPAELVPAVEDTPVMEAGGSPWLAGKLVMIVDDEDAVRLIVSDVVAELGARVLMAEDAISAMDLTDRLPTVQPDVMITDIGMPGGMNGRQLAILMREKFPGLKVLFITGYAEQNILDEGLLEPGCALLVKPFSTDALSRKLYHLLEQV